MVYYLLYCFQPLVLPSPNGILFFIGLVIVLSTRIANIKKTWNSFPDKVHWLIFFGLFVFFLLFASFGDIHWTAKHGYMFVESIFTGNFLDFYNFAYDYPGVTLPPGTGVHGLAVYNIVVYVLFGIFMLPVYLFFSITKITASPMFIIYYGKMIACFFYMGCAYLVYLMAKHFSLDTKKSSLTALYFALFPITFFNTFLAGQYDVIMLFFMLCSFYSWMKGRTFWFVFFMGVAFPFKIFSLLTFIPLLLLKEKRPLHILKSLLLVMWLYLPTTLLFAGRQQAVAAVSESFYTELVDRLFVTAIPGVVPLALFPVLYLALCFFAFLSPINEFCDQKGLWYSLAANGLFFVLVYWHPQWVVILVPFLVLTTALCTYRQEAWFWLDMALNMSFLLLILIHWNDFFFSGMLNLGYPWKTFLYDRGFSIQYIALPFQESVFFNQIGRPIFAGSILLHVFLKMPIRGKMLVERLFGDKETPSTPLLHRHAWSQISVFMAAWSVLAFYEWFTSVIW